MFLCRPGMKYWPIISILPSSNSSNPSQLILGISRCHVNMSRANSNHEYPKHLQPSFFTSLCSVEVILLHMDPTLACCVIY